MKLSLREVLNKEGVSQSSFARQMGVSKAYVNQLCNVDKYYVINATIYGRPKNNRLADNVVIDDITKYIKK